MKDSFKLGLILAAFAAISCTVLAVVNSFTAPIIELHAAEKAEKALHVVFADADTFMSIEDLTTGNKDVETLKAFLDASPIKVDSLNIAYKNDTVVGAVVQVNGPSYDHVTLAVGMDTTCTITGISILETSDSPGYGLKATSPDFYGQFTGIDASNTIVSGEDFDGISGATITSKAYASLINYAVYVGSNYLADNYEGTTRSNTTYTSSKE